MGNTRKQKHHTANDITAHIYDLHLGASATDLVAPRSDGTEHDGDEQGFTSPPSSVNDMVAAYNALLHPKSGGKKRAFVRRSEYSFSPRTSSTNQSHVALANNNSITVYSYNCLESLFRKQPPVFPTLARGMFVVEKGGDSSGGWKIAVRGYDKFFNVGEVASTSWESLAARTTGPYEVTTKENGCIIFAAALAGDLVVTSKHALGPAKNSTVNPDGTTKPSHAQKGEEWVDRHLKSVGKTRQDFVKFLEKHDVTAVFELADDEFEEHILEYPPDRRGLYLHGINENIPAFRTWESSKLKPVATEFGFKIVDALVMNTIQEVRAFTDSCRATGSYKGRAIEGFVVRGRDKGVEGHAAFFKVKYDEPYLMFREWREVTNRILSGKEFKFKPRFELTRRYIAWVREKVKTHPELFEDYKKQKGIIRARNLFLQEAHLPDVGEHIVAEARRTTEEFARGEATLKTEEEIEEAEADALLGGSKKTKKAVPPKVNFDAAKGTNTGKLFGAEKILLIPIATIGAGKTLLGRILTQLFPQVGHIQNDNITAKKAASVFERKVMDQFDTKNIVMADKNNHLYQHRAEISSAFKARYPGGKVVALDWNVEKCVAKMGLDRVVELTAERVENRGENHQSLTPGRTKDYRKVIRNFITKRDPLDQKVEADSLIDVIVSLDLADTPRAHLSKILPELGLPEPIDNVYQKVYNIAVGLKETVVKNVKDTSAKKKPRYYGVKLDPAFDLPGLLDKLFSSHPPELRQMWEQLVSSGRVDKRKAKGWHVTLCMVRAGDPKLEAMCNTYASRLEKYAKEKGSATGTDRTSAGIPVNLELTEVVWDDRVMAIVVGKMPDGVNSANEIPHVTVATASEEIKPVTSNEILGWALAGEKGGEGKTVHRLPFDGTVEVKGEICAFFY